MFGGGLCGEATVELREFYQDPSGRGSVKLLRILTGALRAPEVGRQGWRDEAKSRPSQLEGTLEPTYQVGPLVRSTTHNVRAALKIGSQPHNEGWRGDSPAIKEGPKAPEFCCSTCEEEFVSNDLEFTIEVNGLLKNWR